MMLTGDSSQLFVRSLQRLAASHASDSLPFSKMAICNIVVFDATVLKHMFAASPFLPTKLVRLRGAASTG
jgi:hypothetical protein